jgi:hypothetical protein
LGCGLSRLCCTVCVGQPKVFRLRKLHNIRVFLPKFGGFYRKL